MPGELECVSPQITILLLGNAASGKTQIIRQFVECDFREQYRPTASLQIHYKSVGLNERLYQLALLDLPTPVTPPKPPAADWDPFRPFTPAPEPALVAAYVLVFDLTSDESFAYIRRLHDLLHLGLPHPTANGTGNGKGPDVPLIVMGNKYDLLHANRGHLSKRYAEMVNVIRKQWKWHYVECSAKYNWNIQHAFKTLTKLIENHLYGNRATERLFPVLRRNRCTLC